MLIPRISAYVIMHDDHELLCSALGSIADLVDEIVVVDGAYEWVAPFLEAAGRDPARSSSPGLEAMRAAPGAEKIKYYCGVWKNELSKRSFAYSQCSHSVVYLIDADEIHAVDDRKLSAFLSSDRSVGCLESPLLFSDEAIFWNSKDAEPIGRKPVIFKKAAFDAAGHLGALWLVISEQERRTLRRVAESAFYAEALGVNYHLSLLRPYRTAVNRCRFYCLRYCLEAGRIPWFPAVEVKAGVDLTHILDHLSPVDFDRFMWGHRITIGFDRRPNAAVAAIAVPEGRSRTAIREAYRAYREGVSRLAHITPDDPRILLNGVEYHIDVTDVVRSAEGGESTIRLEFDEGVESISAQSYAARIGGPVAASSHPVALDGSVAFVSTGARPADRLVVGLTARWSRQDLGLVRLTGMQARSA